MEFIHICVTPYLHHVEPDIRKASALTCHGVLIREPIIHQDSYHSKFIVDDIVNMLLAVAVTDKGENFKKLIKYDTDCPAQL